ncbi:uncharacterized protein METZ01_LOCUS325813, partial [marine metagenome]
MPTRKTHSNEQEQVMSKYIRYDFKELNIELNSYTGILSKHQCSGLIQMQGLAEVQGQSRGHPSIH